MAPLETLDFSSRQAGQLAGFAFRKDGTSEQRSPVAPSIIQDSDLSLLNLGNSALYVPRFPYLLLE